MRISEDKRGRSLMDAETAILSGLFTGIGVILAQRLMAFIDKHPLTIKFKKTVDDITNLDRKNGVKRKR